jgi:hypothetical protein
MYPQQSPPLVQVAPDSAQQRTSKVAPRRHDRPEQQSVPVAHVPRTGEHMQEPTPKLHDGAPHVPRVGPPAVPLEQVLVAEHHPQPVIAVQVPQLVALAHGSGMGHELESQLQAVHELPVGPLDVPSSQRPRSAHHPQSSCAVQSPQLVDALQSVPPSQRVPNQSQLAHVLPVGPADVPTRQPTPGHQPQLGRDVHSSQSVASMHGSAAPVHSLVSQLQLEHDPVLGPVELPTWQRPVSPHQPQG